MSHPCHARGCSTPVRPELLMCLRHWRMVPAAIQRAVWATYRPGQCDDKLPSKAWHEAASAAIGYVAVMERQKFTVAEPRAMVAFGVAPPRVVAGLKKLDAKANAKKAAT